MLKIAKIVEEEDMYPDEYMEYKEGTMPLDDSPTH